jgi:uncharacterized surface protein with fasciclin (FAS1) repeats
MPLCAVADGDSDSDSDGDSRHHDSHYYKEKRTITEIVAESGGEFDDNKYDYDILLNAVLAANLQDALADPNADLTVFAPNDKAFIRLARDLGYDGYDEEEAFNTIVAALNALSGGDPISLLTDILLYHVSGGSQYLWEVVWSGGVDTLLGATILPAKLRLLDNEPELKDPKLLPKKSDIKASNGIIHTISRVLIPVDIDNTDESSLPTITELVAASGGEFDRNKKDYDILLNALIATNLAGALDNPDDSLTALAPNDEAFIRTAREVGYHGYDEAGAFNFIVQTATELGGGNPIPLLTQVLLYHVAPGALTAKDVLETSPLPTALESVTIYPDSKRRTLGDKAPQLTDPKLSVGKDSNIRASNGFVQNISRVLIPINPDKL